MIRRKLSKAQGYTIQVLATQLTQSQMAVANAQEALNELAELLRISYKLPEGEARFGQGPDGWTLVVKPAPKPKPESEPEPAAEVPRPEPGSDADIAEINKRLGEMLEVERSAGEPGPSETKAADDA